MPVDITAVGRIELYKDGVLVSRHTAIEEALEKAVDTGDGNYRIKYPERTVKVYGTLAPAGGDTIPPSIPGSLSLVSNGATSVTFSWGASTDNVGVAGYQIFRNGSVLTTTGNTSYTDTGLTPSTPYTYTVAAYDDAGNNSGISGQTPLVVTTSANAAPVWSVTQQELTTNASYTLSLGSVCSDADNNTLSYSVISGTFPTGISFNSVANTVSGTPTSVESKIVTFRATDGIVNADQAITFNVLNADATAPSVPTNLAVSVVSSSQLNLSWTASTDTAGTNQRSTGVASYRVYRDGQLRTTVTAPAVTYSDTGLAASTAYSYRVAAVDAAGNASDQCAPVSATTSAVGANTPEPANYTLEITYPLAAGTAGTGLNSNNRAFYAHTGVTYEIPLCAIGGSYPYTWTVSNAPAGMSVVAYTMASGKTGYMLRWTNPQATATGVQVTCTDSFENTDTETFNIAVGTSGWYFIDANAGDDGNPGTLASPWRSLYKAWLSGGSTGRIYVRAGTYTLDGCTIVQDNDPLGSERVTFNEGASSGPQGPSIFIAYPGDAQPVLDMQYTGSGPDYGSDSKPCIRYISSKVFWDGIKITRSMSKGFWFARNGRYGGQWWRLDFDDHGPGRGSANSACIMWDSAFGTNSFSDCVIDCTFHDIQAGTGNCALKLYSIKKALVEGCDFWDTGTGITEATLAQKADVPFFTFRGNRVRAQNEAAYGGNMDANSGERCSGEICYNLFLNSTVAGIGIGLGNFTGLRQPSEFFIYRNTIVAPTNCGVADYPMESTGGPYHWRHNVIVNNNSAYTDRISVAGDLSRITYTDNLPGAPSTGIVDANGNLTGTNTSYLGTRGHEIP